MVKFAQVIETVDEMSVEEQETLVEIVSRRLAQRQRTEIIKEVRQSRRQFRSGKYRFASADEIIAGALK